MSGRVIETCDGYKHLLKAVEADKKSYPDESRSNDNSGHGYMAHLRFAVSRAKHYGEKLGLEPADILDAWEKRRDYWYMNYYQDANMPLIDAENVRVFDSLEDLKKSIGKHGFRCPHCGGISSNPYECNSGIVHDGKKCDWKSYGLLGCLGKGAYIYIKEKLSGQTIFFPVAWEK